MYRSIALLLTSVVALTACNTDQTQAALAPQADAKTTPAPPPMPGSDQDAHGCKASAGYTWCARSARCERPWELAAAEGLANADDAFRQWCRDTDTEQHSAPAEN